MERKKLSSSLQTKKVDETKEDQIIKKLEGASAVEDAGIKKMTVEIPEYLHKKLKVAAASSGKKVKDLIIELIDKM